MGILHLGLLLIAQEHIDAPPPQIRDNESVARSASLPTYDQIVKNIFEENVKLKGFQDEWLVRIGGTKMTIVRPPRRIAVQNSAHDAGSRNALDQRWQNNHHVYDRAQDVRRG